MSDLQPVERAARIEAIDVIRGLAVLGIFFINHPLYVGPSAAFFNWREDVWWTWAPDKAVLLATFILAQGKFYTLFSFLFGLGFGLQMGRAAQREATDFLARYRRRLLVLLAIGLAHFYLVWWGDVLTVYSLLGFPLLLLRNVGERKLLRIAAVMLAVPLIGGAIGMTVSELRKKPEEPQKKAREEAEQRRRFTEDLRVMRTGSYLDILQHRARKNASQWGVNAGWSIELFANFILGLWAARRGVLERPEEHWRLLGRLFGLGLPAGLVISAMVNTAAMVNGHAPFTLTAGYLFLLNEFVARPLMAFGMAAGIVMLVARGARLVSLAAVGRMALTNYLLASLVWTTVANGYGGGRYGTINPWTGLGCIVAFYALQVVLSRWWLGRFRYGPAEWLWRTATYGRRQPLRIA